MKNFLRTFVAAALFLAVPATYGQQAANSAQGKPTDRPKMTREERRLEKEARRIDREASDPAGEERVLTRLSGDLGVSTQTLKQQREQSKLSYGNLFIANSLAKSSGTTFSQIAAERESGNGWGKIAKDHNLKLGEVVSGAKKNANAVEATRRNEERRVQREQKEKREREEAEARKSKPAPSSTEHGKSSTPPPAKGQGKPGKP